MSRRLEDARPRRTRWWLVAILAASIITFAVSLYNIVAIVSEDAEEESVIEVMRSYVQTSPASSAAPMETTLSSGASEAPASAAVSEAAAPDPEAPSRLILDFEGLQKLNEDILGWIDIPGTDISYPIVQTEDNDYYLTHSADKSRNRAGAIFLDYRTPGDFSNRNTIIYGHRMNNGSMFGTLQKLQKAEYLAEHPYIHIYLPDLDEPLVYEIFSTKENSASMNTAVYQVDLEDPETAAEWLAEIGPAENLTDEDLILTLSTCVKGDGNTRFIVQAKLLPANQDQLKALSD